MMTLEYTEEKRKELDMKVEKMIEDFNPFAFNVLQGRFFENVKLCLISAYGEERADEVYREVIVKHYRRIAIMMHAKREAEFKKRNNLSPTPETHEEEIKRLRAELASMSEGF